jgi:predicted metal-dependent phosphoesterase TrpH
MGPEIERIHLEADGAAADGGHQLLPGAGTEHDVLVEQREVHRDDEGNTADHDADPADRHLADQPEALLAGEHDEAVAVDSPLGDGHIPIVLTGAGGTRVESPELQRLTGRWARLLGALIDLHTHTNRSDGSDPPERIPELAAAAGCSAVAITDHDRLDGIDRARARGQELGVRVIGGCELSVGSDAGPLHLLAYFVEDGDGPLQRALTSVQEGRTDRNRRLAARLAELGLPASLEEIEAEAGGGGVGRPHVAAVLVRKGVVASVQEAFDLWLAAGRPGYVERRRLDLAAATTAIHESGGVAVVAHPLMLGLQEAGLEQAVATMAAQGVDGLEAIYGRYTPEERATLAAVAERHGLVVTGGSDYHGAYKPDLQVGTGLGDLAVPDEVLVRLEAQRPAGADGG